MGRCPLIIAARVPITVHSKYEAMQRVTEGSQKYHRANELRVSWEGMGHSRRARQDSRFRESLVTSDRAGGDAHGRLAGSQFEQVL